MEIGVEDFGKFFIIFHWEDDPVVDCYDNCGEDYSFKDAVNFASQNITCSPSLMSADIIDVNTGEIVITIKCIEKDV